MTRSKAAFTHLLISITLSSIVICLLLFAWYPLPFFWAMGGPLLLVLIIGIDVVLGPLMTLILFNPKKSRRALTVDLSLIAIVQIAALSYGMYSGYISRLAYGVFDGEKFQLVQAGDLAPDFLKKAKLPAYRELPLVAPKFSALAIPDDDKTRNDLAFFKAFNIGPQFMPEYFVTLEQGRDQIAKAAIAQSVLEKNHPSLATEIDTLLQANQLSWQQIAVVPFDVRTGTYTAVVNLTDMTVLKVLTKNPQ